MKRFLTLSVVAATMAWSLGLAGLAPQASAAYTPADGDIIKTATNPAVYYILDGKRLLFSNRVTYGSWFADFSTLKVIAQADFDAIPSGGNVTVRPGVNLIKFDNSSTVYAVATANKICKITSADAAKALYGDNWSASVVTIQVAFEGNYTVDATCELTATSKYPAGSLIKASGSSDIYYWDGTSRRLVSSEAFIANGFKSSLVKTVADVTAYGTLGAALTAKEAPIAAPAAGSGTTTPVVSGNFSVALASDTPASGTLVAGQAIADLAHFVITNTGSSEVKVTSLSFKRIGVSADATLAAVYLYEGANRLTDGASVSTGNINFNDASGIITIPAGGSKTVAVKSNITSGTSGQTIGVAYVNANGSLTSGNLMNIATATLADVSFANTTYPAANSSLDPQNDFVIWENTVTVGTTKVDLKSIRFKQIGSINSNDIKNFRLFVDGTQKSSVATLDTNGYVTFDLTSSDLTSSPVSLNTGNRNIKVMVDIIGGSTRTAQLSLRMAADVLVVDTEYGQPVLVKANSTTFSARDAGAQTISGGTLTITKKSDSPSGDVTNGATGVTLAKYELKASGEKMKVESLRFYVDEDDNHTAFTLRNGAIFANGTQVGSSAAIAADTDSTLGYTEFTFGSSLIVEPGTPVTLEVRADVYDNDGTNEVANSDTLRVYVDNSSASNVLKMTSNGYDSVPATDVAANQLTVKEGSLTVAKNTSYGDRTAVAPKQAYKLASFTISASTVEKVNLNTISLDFDGVADAADASSDLSNLYVVYGGATSTIKQSVADTANSWSISKEMTPGQTLSVDVYADVAASITDGDGTADTIRTDLTITAQTVGSSVPVSPAEVQGQTITWSAGSFTPGFANTPLSYITAGNKMVTAGEFNFTSVNDDYTIKEFEVHFGSAAISSAIKSVRVFDGGIDLTSSTEGFPVNGDSNTSALVTGLNVSVPAGTTKKLTVKVDLNMIGTGYGTTGSNVQVAKIDDVKYADSQGVEATDATDYAGTSKNVIVFRTIPTVAQVDLSNSSALVNGASTELYKFTISADASGPMALKQIKLPITWSDGGTADTLEIESFKLYLNGDDYTSAVTIKDNAGNDVTDGTGVLEANTAVYVTFSNELDIPASATYTFSVRGVPQGFRMTGADTQGDSFSMYLAGDSTSNGTSVYLVDAAVADGIFGLSATVGGAEGANSFIWSDYGVTPHSETNGSSSADWHNGYLVKSLDLGGETWSK